MKRSDALLLIEEKLGTRNMAYSGSRKATAELILTTLENIGMQPPRIRAKFNVGNGERTIYERTTSINRWEPEELNDRKEKKEKEKEE